MKKFFKILGISLLVVVLVVVGAGAWFIHRITNGKQVYEQEAPTLPDLPRFSVLVFSKTNAFRHGEAIEASLP
ncbi:MAG: ThuA domain-containing protein, partial [Bacteroidota bacterium]